MTFSIVGRCQRTGRLGVALATALPGAGSHCVQAAGGVGAVAVQGYTNPLMGAETLRSLRAGMAAVEALTECLTMDPDPDRRQVLVIDGTGDTAAHTGTETFSWRGDVTCQGVAAAANMVPSGRVIDAMVSSFQDGNGEALWWRLTRALAAGEGADRDRLRPCRSAVVRVVDTEDYPLLEARVDASDRPIDDLFGTVEAIERDLLTLTRMLPTRRNPAGTFDVVELDRRGLMPRPWDTPSGGRR